MSADQLLRARTLYRTSWNVWASEGDDRLELDTDQIMLVLLQEIRDELKRINRQLENRK